MQQPRSSQRMARSTSFELGVSWPRFASFLRGRRRRAAIGAALAIAAVGVFTASVAFALPGSWTLSASPNALDTSGNNDPSYLNAAACAKASDCWAVGSFTQPGLRQTLTEHYDGSAWSVVSSPNTGTDTNLLKGVACPSAMNCWAVGYYHNTTLDRDQTLIEHYNGTAWKVASSPNPGNAFDALDAVTCLDARNCWAVGSQGIGQAPAGVVELLIEHYNGSSWSVVSGPNVPGSPILQGVSCASASDCWAAGYYITFCNPPYPSELCDYTLIAHYDGSAWSRVSSPNPSANNDLYGVSCAAANYCIAVGNAGHSTLILRDTGGGWRVVTSPNPSFPQLNGVSCTTTKFCTAVGEYYDASVNNLQTLIEQSVGGGAWTIVPSPNADTSVENTLSAVTCTSGCFAVGTTSPSGTGGTPATLIEHYGPDPTKTTVSCSPNPVAVNKPTKCTAHVTDKLIPLNTPTGTVTWSGGVGTFSATSCTLNRRGSCSVTFTPSTRTGRTITGNYGGDADHMGSHGSRWLRVT